MRSDDPALSFEVELGDVPSQDENQDEGEQEDDDLKGGEEDVGHSGRREFLGIADEKFDREKEDDEKKDEGSDDAGAFFPGIGHGLRSLTRVPVLRSEGTESGFPA